MNKKEILGLCEFLKLNSYENTDNISKFIFGLQQENKQLKENYGRIYNENCKLREEHNITDISLLDENYKLKDNWNKLKEYIDIKLYNMEYLQKLCGCRLDDEIHIILDIIKKEMKELEGSDSNE